MNSQLKSHYTTIRCKPTKKAICVFVCAYQQSSNIANIGDKSRIYASAVSFAPPSGHFQAGPLPQRRITRLSCCSGYWPVSCCNCCRRRCRLQLVNERLFYKSLDFSRTPVPSTKVYGIRLWFAPLVHWSSNASIYVTVGCVYDGLQLVY